MSKNIIQSPLKSGDLIDFGGHISELPATAKKIVLKKNCENY